PGRLAAALGCAYGIEGRQQPNQFVRRRDVVTEVDVVTDGLGEIVRRAPGWVVARSIHAAARPRSLERVGLEVLRVSREHVKMQAPGRPAFERCEPTHPVLRALLEPSEPAPELEEGCLLGRRRSEGRGDDVVPNELSGEPLSPGAAGLERE